MSDKTKMTDLPTKKIDEAKAEQVKGGNSLRKPKGK
jgi:hypothetical protein